MGSRYLSSKGKVDGNEEIFAPWWDLGIWEEKMKSFEQWLVENNFANTGQTREEIASAIMLELNIAEITKAVLQNKVVANNLYYDPMLYRQYLNSEERNEKELRSIRNAIEIIKKLFAENAELRKRLEN